MRNASEELRPDWSGIYAYGCRAYPLNRDRAAGLHRRGFKVSPRGHIGYLVGYRASNIYRIWVPVLEQNEQISDTVPIYAPSDNLGGGSTPHDDSELGPAQNQSNVPTASRERPWAGDAQRIREERKDGSGQLFSPEPTPQPEAQGGGDRSNPRTSGETDKLRLQQQALQGQESQESRGSISASQR